MTIQGSINQLLTLSAVALKSSDTAKRNTEIRNLDKEVKKLEGIIDKDQGEEADLDKIYELKEKAFYLNPTKKRYEELEKLYSKTSEGSKQKNLERQVGIQNIMNATDPVYAKQKAEWNAATALYDEQERIRSSKKSQGGKI